MNLNWRKRLDKVAASVTQSTSGVMFFQLDGESEEDMDQRVARWKAGDTVEGMDCEYTGRESSIWLIKPVKPPNRNE